MNHSTGETTGRGGGFLRALAAIGPGIVVAGSVIGSGELINTPVQAATFGFVLLWVVLLSCVIKYFLQVEIARHCLVHNRTTVQALNECPGPKWRGTSWIALLYMLGYFITMLTTIGIIVSLGGLMHGIWPLAESEVVSTRIWGAIMVLSTMALLWQGWYRHLEMSVMVLVGGFSLSVFVGVLLIQGTEYRISVDDVLSGLTFSLGDNPRGAAFAVVSLMGALGVAANELFMYPYWILEKGYARELGDPHSAGWVERARHWIRVIQLDAGFSTILATLVTAAFFLLGAAVLYGHGDPPSGLTLVHQIAQVFTVSYGESSRALFLAGAFCTLYSTLVVTVAATGRMWADLFDSLGFINLNNAESVRRCHQIVQVVWLLGLLVATVSFDAQPQWLIPMGHFALGVLMTPFLMFAIVWLAFRTDRRARMGPWTAFLLLSSSAIILGCVALNVVIQLGD